MKTYNRRDFMEDEQHNVTLDVAGKGVLYFVRTNHWHGSPWRYTIDGNRYTVAETATSDPVNAKKNLNKTTFIPEQSFPEPLAFTWSTTMGDWSGNFVGTSFIFTHEGNLETLEGDPRFFFDDSRTPHAQGTGTEEWGGGGDYWGGRNMTLPFAGHPCGIPNKKDAKNDKD